MLSVSMRVLLWSVAVEAISGKCIVIYFDNSGDDEVVNSGGGDDDEYPCDD
jgi:hypothetical protein